VINFTGPLYLTFSTEKGHQFRAYKSEITIRAHVAKKVKLGMGWNKTCFR